MDVSAANCAARTRQRLLAAGFTVDGVLGRLGSDAFAALSRRLFVPARRALGVAGGEPMLDDLIRCFLLAEPTPAAHWPEELLADLAELELVRSAGDTVLPQVEMHPYGTPDADWFLVSDVGQPQHPDHVLGLGGASVTLTRITPRDPVGRALDLGCGAGVQALHASRHAAHVVATDTNPRAIQCTWLSAALSGLDLDRLDLRTGSLFEPVAGERFDLIVSNPPFVISPARHFTYRDAGLPADELSHLIVTGAVEHLAPGGTAVVLASWLQVAGKPWWDRPSGWLEQTGASGWIVQRDVQSVVDYTDHWLRDAGQSGAADFDEQFAAWLDEFAAQGAVSVGFGWVVLQAAPPEQLDEAADGQPWVVPEDLSRSARLPSGAEVAEYVAGCVRVGGLDVADLLDSAAHLSDGVAVTQVWDGMSRGQAAVRLGRPGIVGPNGWRPEAVVDALLLDALTREAADTTRPIGEILDDKALSAGLEPLDLLAPWLVALRELLRTGIVRIG